MYSRLRKEYRNSVCTPAYCTLLEIERLLKRPVVNPGLPVLFIVNINIRPMLADQFFLNVLSYT